MRIATHIRTVKLEATAASPLIGLTVDFAHARRALLRLARTTMSVKTTCTAGTPLHKTELGTQRDACRCIVNLKTLYLDGFKYQALTIPEFYLPITSEMVSFARAVLLILSMIPLPDVQA
jgi:hypothetical protein